MLGANTYNNFCNYVLEIIDTNTYKSKQIAPEKTHKHICIVKFYKQAFEAIWLQKIINQTDIIKTLPYNLQEKESIPYRHI